MDWVLTVVVAALLAIGLNVGIDYLFGPEVMAAYAFPVGMIAGFAAIFFVDPR